MYIHIRLGWIKYLHEWLIKMWFRKYDEGRLSESYHHRVQFIRKKSISWNSPSNKLLFSIMTYWFTTMHQTKLISYLGSQLGARIVVLFLGQWPANSERSCGKPNSRGNNRKHHSVFTQEPKCHHDSPLLHNRLSPHRGPAARPLREMVREDRTKLWEHNHHLYGLQYVVGVCGDDGDWKQRK